MFENLDITDHYLDLEILLFGADELILVGCGRDDEDERAGKRRGAVGRRDLAAG